MVSQSGMYPVLVACHILRQAACPTSIQSASDATAWHEVPYGQASDGRRGAVA